MGDSDVNRLTPATVTMLMFAIVGGLIVAYIGKNLLASSKPAGPATRSVPMPLADIPEGTLLTPRHIGTGPVLESELSREVLLSMNSILGRVVKTKLTAATPIRSNMLYSPNERAPLTPSEGHQAAAITVTGAAALLSGMIKPSQFVDVHFTPNDVDNIARFRGGMTMRLIKGIKVLAINGQTQQSAINGDTNVVVLDATPAQVNVLIQAEKKGVFALATGTGEKGDGLVAVKDEDRAFFEEILGIAPLETPDPKKDKEPFVSQAFVGNDRTELSFRDGKRISEYQGFFDRNRADDLNNARDNNDRLPWEPQTNGNSNNTINDDMNNNSNPGPSAQRNPSRRGAGFPNPTMR